MSFQGVCVGGPYDGKSFISEGPLLRVAIWPMPEFSVNVNPHKDSYEDAFKFVEYRWNGEEFRFRE